MPGFPPGTVLPTPPGPQKKKEKPLEKTPIPGTDWLRVVTTEGNTFYTHKVEKRSIWTVPDEIRDAVQALEHQEQEARAKAEHEAKEKAERDAKRVEEEVQRIKSEVQGMVGKRKAEESVPVDELVITKKPKVDDEEEDEDEDEDESEEEEEEEWQREAAAQLAAEAEEERKRQEEERKRQEEEEKKLKEAETARGKAQLNMPDRVDLSLDEAKALFKVSGGMAMESAREGSLQLFILDTTPGKRRQPPPPLGHLPPALYLRPALCPPPFCLRAQGGIRRVLPRPRP